jgi:hypothetical protein
MPPIHAVEALRKDRQPSTLDDWTNRNRRSTDKPRDHEIDWVGVWIGIFCFAVIVAVFGGTLAGTR